MRRLVGLVICSVAVVAVYFLYHELRDDFCLGNINCEIPAKLEWDVPTLTLQEHEEVSRILSERYTYLGKGHQSYAFVSEDGEYVLKFIKFTYLKPNKVLEWLPDIAPIVKYREKMERRKERRVNRVFEGYRLAYENDKENSGLIYIHLKKSGILKKQVQVEDRYGFKHLIDLDPIVFIIQRKGIITREVLQALMKKQDIESVKVKIRQIFNLYLSEYQHGLYDGDHNIMSNTGFVGNNPIRLDVGRLSKNTEMSNPEFYKKDLVKIAKKRIQRWFQNNYPHYSKEINEFMESTLSTLLNDNIVLSNQ